MTQKHSRRTRNWPIQDCRLLADLLKRFVEHFYDGNTSAAARDLELDQSELSRLREGKRKQLRAQTVTLLNTALPAQMRLRLQDALTTSGGRRALEEYGRWMQRFNQFITSWWEVSYRPIDTSDTPKLGAMSPALVLELEDLLDCLFRLCEENLRAFLLGLESHGQVNEERIALALIRTVEPLLDTFHTAGIERSWREMTDKELARFFVAGLSREEIMLNRSPDIQRAHEQYPTNAGGYSTRIRRSTLDRKALRMKDLGEEEVATSDQDVPITIKRGPLVNAPATRATFARIVNLMRNDNRSSRWGSAKPRVRRKPKPTKIQKNRKR